MPELLEVRFKGNRKAYYSWDNEAPIPVGGDVLVEADRGLDFGTVTAVGAVAERKCGIACGGCAPGAAPEPQGRVVRQASGEDARLARELRKAEDEVRQKVIERVRALGLDMKISDTEWQWDRKKLSIYFTAEQRVDFRNLVRELAGLFRTRIDLRQIGARDEAKRLDGVGRCGRQYCCSSWLPELRPVSLALAKDQHLSLNPSQISGGCGRLLCCLRYEHEFYVASRKRFPKEGKTLQTPRGTERVQGIDIFRDRVLLRAEDGATRTVPLVQLREETGAAGAAVEPPPAAPDAAAGPVAPPAEGTAAPAPTQGPAPSAEPHRKRRRRRGRRRDRPQSDTPSDPSPSPTEDSAPEPEPPGE
ncbi:MAG TPA: regulatory iron-sulfur-containing complex subunit RicT [Gemmatimonadales bacterium]|nr:regulatory iron-sulfur-containing complex subunit RicT [Gemmatimonadales bacterium]